MGGCETPSEVIEFIADLALVKTKDEIIFNHGVGITCLPWRHYNEDYDEYAGQKVEVAGWGWTEHAFGPDALQKVTLDVITLSSCRDIWEADITSAKMCTLTTNKDTCNGDSGGSIFWTAPDNGLLYSIAHVDLGLQFCAREIPAINTRIAPNLEWILQNSPESNYCIV